MSEPTGGPGRRSFDLRDDSNRLPKDIDDEVAFHIREKVRHLRASGMGEDEAWSEALRRFGDVEEVKAAMKRQHWGQWVGRSYDEVWQDVRFAVRQLLRNPGFAGVTVLILALGIGATAAIFSLLDAALLSRPAVDDPESLVAIYTTCRRGAPRCSSSYPDFEDYRDQTGALQDLAATSLLPASLGADETGARLVLAGVVTGNYFGLLGVAPEVGRVLVQADDSPGEGSQVAVLSNALWRDHFGADPDVVGRTVRLNDTPFEVIGVAAADFRGLTLSDDADMWIPLQWSGAVFSGPVSNVELMAERGARWINRLVGRMAPGAGVEQTRAELLSVSEALRVEDPDARGPRSVTLDPLGRYLVPVGSEQALPQFVWLLMGVVAVTLLLACANLANLLLARASTRASELGVRVAIGAGRRRLVRQLLAESALLSLVGGLAGLAVTVGLLRLLAVYELPGGIPIAALDAGIDGRVLAVAIGLSALTAVLFGLVPALHATRPDVVANLKSGQSLEGRRGGGKLRRGLVTLQVALCVVLLVGSGLFVRTLRSALDADLGFRPESVALTRFHLAMHGYGEDEALGFIEELRARALSSPVVRAAAAGTVVPIRGGGRRGYFAEVDGYEPGPDEEMRVDVVAITPGYFETLRIPMMAGRDFSSADADGATRVAIISREMASRYWPGGQALGGTLTLTGGEPLEVVGIAENVHWSNLDEVPTNFVFLPLVQTTRLLNGTISLVARVDGDPTEYLATLRQEAEAVDPGVSLSLLTTMEEAVGDLLMPQRMGVVLLTAFGLLALLLAGVGIAAVVSYTVRQQRRAIGVRMALGARRGQVQRVVLRGMAGPVALGLLVGLPTAAVLDGSLERFLYGVSPGDPVTYLAIALGLSLVALVATLVPAREAARVDPLKVLKSE